MEFLNRIDLRGIVGKSSVTRIGETQLCRFSLVTEYAHKDKDGNQIVEVTWHNVVAFDSKTMPDLEQIQKGSIVRVRGRVRAFRVTMADGTEKSCWEVVARSVTIEPEK
jgi:Single-stranded DNA-binding protein